MLDKIINKIGVDKILHFCVGAIISFCITNVAILQEGTVGMDNLWFPFVGIIVAMIFECMKEFIIDIKPDWKDFLATFLGAFLVFVVNGIGIFFYTQSY